jgi:hypothetical protein
LLEEHGRPWFQSALVSSDEKKTIAFRNLEQCTFAPHRPLTFAGKNKPKYAERLRPGANPATSEFIAASVIYKKKPNLNNRPTGENSPNLVTLFALILQLCY